MDDAPRIGPECRVTLHFTLRLADGEVVDSTREGAPPAFVTGDGSLPAGFEAALLGLKAGDRRSVLVDAASGFGARNPENVRVMDRSQFSPGVELARGLVIAFADKQGELPGVVTAFDADKVTVDFNHPLAGRDLTFEVEILAVERESAAVPVAIRAATPRSGAAS